jgi:FkbM family methyltransferase
MTKLKAKFLTILPKWLTHFYIKVTGLLHRSSFETEELKRITSIPRYVTGTTNLYSKEITFVDSASFIFMFKEIVHKQIYQFKTTNERPYIIDAGANIGLSIIYFKQLYPDAEIIAFEADEKIFSILQKNLIQFGFDNITLIQKALWNEETTLSFFSEGADAGRVGTAIDAQDVTEVKTIRLKKYLEKKVDFLKVDIEGAEVIVLEDCKDLLENVTNIFVEYHSFVAKNNNLHTLLTILYDAGFKIYITAVNNSASNPFMEKHDYLGMDFQLNIYAINNNQGI